MTQKSVTRARRTRYCLYDRRLPFQGALGLCGTRASNALMFQAALLACCAWYGCPPARTRRWLCLPRRNRRGGPAEGKPVPAIGSESRAADQPSPQQRSGLTCGECGAPGLRMGPPADHTSSRRPRSDARRSKTRLRIPARSYPRHSADRGCPRTASCGTGCPRGSPVAHASPRGSSGSVRGGSPRRGRRAYRRRTDRGPRTASSRQTARIAKLGIRFVHARVTRTGTGPFFSSSP